MKKFIDWADYVWLDKVLMCVPNLYSKIKSVNIRAAIFILVVPLFVSSFLVLAIPTLIIGLIRSSFCIIVDP